MSSAQIGQLRRDNTASYEEGRSFSKNKLKRVEAESGGWLPCERSERGSAEVTSFGSHSQELVGCGRAEVRSPCRHMAKTDNAAQLRPRCGWQQEEFAAHKHKSQSPHATGGTTGSPRACSKGHHPPFQTNVRFFFFARWTGRQLRPSVRKTTADQHVLVVWMSPSSQKHII